MIARLEKVDSLSGHPIDHTMFLVNSAAPATGEIMAQRLGFAYSPEWIVENRRHKVKNPKRGFAVSLNPAPQVLAKVR